MGVEYDSGTGVVQTALRFRNTIIPLVINNIEFWLLFFMNLGVCIAFRSGWYDPEKYGLDIPHELTGVTTGLMSFFTVFYNSHCFHRYNDLYDEIKQMEGALLEFTSSLRARIKSKRHTRRALRYMMCSVFCFFFEEASGGIVSEAEMDQIRRLGLVTVAEVNSLTDLRQDGGPADSTFFLDFALQTVCAGVPDFMDRDDMISSFFDKAFLIRRVEAKVIDTLALPMPFQYFHILAFMMCMNLMIWAYVLGTTETNFAPVIFLFIQMIFQGLRELSAALSNPFGDDDVDFPLNRWLWEVLVKNRQLLETQFDATKMIKREQLLPSDTPLLVDFFRDTRDREQGEAKAEQAARTKIPWGIVCAILALAGVVYAFYAGLIVITPPCRGHAEQLWDKDTKQCATCCSGEVPVMIRGVAQVGHVVRAIPLLAPLSMGEDFRCFADAQDCHDFTGGECVEWVDPCTNFDPNKAKCTDRGQDMTISSTCKPCCPGLEWYVVQAMGEFRYRCHWDLGDCQLTGEMCTREHVEPCRCCEGEAKHETHEGIGGFSQEDVANSGQPLWQ
mmetsp:Transcript_9923/g.21804  ORF Transcript_9923/g.21804 Transcript_9923/m.21804 type:complete len:559 (+) Transcript_9923:76-1752(+)